MDYATEKKQLKVYFLVIIVAGAFLFGVLAGRYDSGKASLLTGEKKETQAGENLDAGDVEMLDEVLTVLSEKYVGDLPDKKKIVEGAARGIVDSLEDPYTVFWDEKESNDFLDEMEGSFEGIGAEIGIRDEVLTIVAPLDGMPAQKAGIEAGDVILKINDELTSEMSVDSAVSKLKGPKGTTVKVTVYRKDDNNGDPFDVEITRDVIDLKSVKWEKKGEDVAYIRVSAFLRDTEDEFETAMKEVQAAGAKKIVLDLRNNPGGFLEGSVDLAGHFLERGSLVVTEDYGEENQSHNKEHFTRGTGELKDYQLVILVNNGSASAAEILAGAIRDNRGVKLVGEDTFGKGSVQEMQILSNGDYLKVTIAKWLTPNGTSIDKEGLKVDVAQELDAEKDGDEQLEKALEMLR